MDVFSAHTRHSLEKGFTLIELLVVVVMFATLLLGLIVTFNPLGQINKAKNLDREHNLDQIKSALDSYYNDNGCYPTALTFGSIWQNNNSVYMPKVPQDPDFVSGSTSNLPYVYQTDGSSCPQWNVLYAGLRVPINISLPCPLAKRTACVPQGFNSFYNFCLSSGTVNCAYIASTSLQTGPTPTQPATPTPTVGPTPTPYIVNCQTNYYACTGDNRCNVLSVDPVSHQPTQCFGYGGTYQCYCDNLCRVNGVLQCAH